jgi:chromosome segregation ATPase
MSATRDESLELSDVKERFEASTVALAEVQQRLRDLTALQEKRLSASEGLERVSAQLAEFTAAATGAVEALLSAQVSATAAFESMRSVVDGTDLRQVAEGVLSIDRRLSEVEEDKKRVLDNLNRVLDERLDSLRAKVDSVAKVVAATDETQQRTLGDLEKRLEMLAAAFVRGEEAHAQQAQELRRSHDDLTHRLDKQDLLQKEKEEVAAELAHVRRELGSLSEDFEKLSAAAGEKALRKAGLKEGGSSLFG